jgi:FAD/FMN-containing dehydrogenase
MQQGIGKISDDSLKELKANTRGKVTVPGDSDYNQARQIWNGMIDKRPGIIVRCAGVSDVINSVKFARKHSLDLAVRGGGHNVAGNAICDDGLVIDFSGMKSIRVDPKSRIARTEPGIVWSEFDRETQEFGLGLTGGLVSSTGVAGFTLGGGIGWLARKYGLALDNLISVDLITADGELLKASEKENADLFWGIRGGGGNFGIVTSFEFSLHPVGPLLLSGMVIHPIAEGKEVLSFYREFQKNTPDELTTLVAMITAPPAHFLPSSIHNKQVIAVMGCYCGPIEEGERVLQPLRNFSKDTAIDMFQPMPYRVFQSLLDAAAPAHLQNYWKSEYLSELSDGAINTILANNSKITSPMSAIHIHQMGGAIARVAEDATAFGLRDASFILNIVATWPDPSENDRNIQWVRSFFSEMQQFSHKGGVYVNFLGEEGADRVKAAYGEEKYKRLVGLKRKYDPTNFFHLNQNIKP